MQRSHTEHHALHHAVAAYHLCGSCERVHTGAWRKHEPHPERACAEMVVHTAVDALATSKAGRMRPRKRGVLLSVCLRHAGAPKHPCAQI